MAIRPKYESAAGHEMAQNSASIFIYTSWKLLIEKSKEVVNVSHDHKDFCMI